MEVSVRKELLGKLQEEPIFYYTISNDSGVSFQVTDYGATILSLCSPDRYGNSEEITINYETLEEIVENHGPYYGSTVGRVANRIKNGKFVLNGKDYSLAINNSKNHLHGGMVGFDQRIWKGIEIRNYRSAGVEFTYHSLDEEEGYPGNLIVSFHD